MKVAVAILITLLLPSQGVFAAQQETMDHDLLEAAFLWILKYSGKTSKRYPGTYCLNIELISEDSAGNWHTRDVEVDEILLERIRKEFLSVKKISDCEQATPVPPPGLHPTGVWRDKETLLGATLFWVQVSEEGCAVECSILVGWRKGFMNLGHQSLRAQKLEGRWKLKLHHKDRIIRY